LLALADYGIIQHGVTVETIINLLLCYYCRRNIVIISNSCKCVRLCAARGLVVALCDKPIYYYK
jgi:hypothetical protein